MSHGYAARHAAPHPLTAWTRRRLSILPRPFWVLCASAAVFRLGFFVIPFRSYYLAHQHHLTATQASIIMAAFGAGWALSQPVGGTLADRHGRRTVITLGALGSAAAFLAFGAAHTYPQLLATAAATGLTFDLYRPALQALTTDIVTSPPQRKHALALLYLILNASRGIACITAGLLATHGMHWLFAANATINIACALVIHRTITDHRTITRPGRYTTVLRDRRMLAFTLLTLGFFTVHMQSVIVLPIAMSQTGISPLAFGLLLAADPLIVTLIQLTIHRRLMRLPALKACALGAAVVGVGLAVAGHGTSITWFAAALPLWISGEVLFLSLASDVVARLAPPQQTARYFGLWGAAQGCAALLAPLLAAALITTGGTRLLWTAAAATGAATGIGCLTLHRRITRRPRPHIHIILTIAPSTRRRFLRRRLMRILPNRRHELAATQHATQRAIHLRHTVQRLQRRWSQWPI